MFTVWNLRTLKFWGKIWLLMKNKTFDNTEFEVSVQVYLCEGEFSWPRRPSDRPTCENFNFLSNFLTWSMTSRRPGTYPGILKDRPPIWRNQKLTKIYGKLSIMQFRLFLWAWTSLWEKFLTFFYRASVLSEVQTSRNSQLPASKNLLVLGMFASI